MSTKRTHYKSLDLAKKYKILQRLWKVEIVSRLSEIYGVPCTTINDIKKNGDRIEEFMCKTQAAEGNVLKRKTLTF